MTNSRAVNSKAKAEVGPKKQSVTVMGITFDVDPDALDDYELFEKLVDLGDSPASMVILVKAITGDDYKAVKDALRDDNGKLTMERMAEFMQQAGTAITALKN